MAAAAIVSWKNDELLVLIKSLYQIADKTPAHQRMIDRAENDPVGIDSLQTTQARADGRKLP